MFQVISSLLPVCNLIFGENSHKFANFRFSFCCMVDATQIHADLSFLFLGGERVCRKKNAASRPVCASILWLEWVLISAGAFAPTIGVSRFRHTSKTNLRCVRGAIPHKSNVHHDQEAIRFSWHHFIQWAFYY